MENVKEKKKSVTLTLTENCNLNCVYCYEHNKSFKTMSLEVAKKIIDKEMLADDGFNSVTIDFFGGEPFLEFQKIKELADFIISQNYDKNYIMFATTNGTLIHGEIQQWLIEKQEIFQIGLSLDGTKMMHDLNRSNSFNDIDLDFYRKYYSHQGIKMTISQQTLPYLFEGVKFCHDLGLDCNCNLAHGIDWSNENNKFILERELMKLIDYYIENPNIKPCSLLDARIEILGYDNADVVNKKWCGVGTNMYTYDVDGNLFPCQFFMELSCGKEKSKNLEFPESYTDEVLDEKCKTCIIKAICPTCYGSNYVSTGSIYSKDENMCVLDKIIIKACSYLKALRWENGQLKVHKNEEQALIRAIIKIQEKLVI